MKPRRMLCAALTGLTAVAAGSAVAGPALAATPQFIHQQINFSPPGGIDQCGLHMTSVVQGTFTSEMFVDATGNVTVEQDEAHVVSTMTNVKNGKVVYVEASSRDRFDLAPVVNRDGTITFTDTITGSPERVYTDHSSVLVYDVGLVSIVDTVDQGGNLLSEQVVIHGIHQVSGPDVAYCDAIVAAVG